VHASPEEADAAVARYERAVEVLHASPPDFDLPSGLREERELRWDRSEAGLPAAPAGAARSVARAVGSAVHRFLETWDARSEGTALAALPSMARAAAQEERVDPGDVEKEARAIVGAFLSSPLPARLRELRVLGREIPVLHRDAQGVTWRGSIDLLYEDAGVLVVADYKTDLDAEGAVERYRGQLAVYVAAVERAMSRSRSVRAELWMLRAGTILNVDAGAPAC
jgi:ATP-dependent exoDNAse (exonuclease V) beta subunit